MRRLLSSMMSFCGTTLILAAVHLAVTLVFVLLIPLAKGGKPAVPFYIVPLLPFIFPISHLSRDVKVVVPLTWLADSFVWGFTLAVFGWTAYGLRRAMGRRVKAST